MTEAPRSPKCPVCGSNNTGWCLESAEPMRTVRCLERGCAAVTVLDEQKTTDHRYYLGANIHVHQEGSFVVLTRDFPYGSRHEIRLEPAVLDEFLAYVEGIEPPVWRAERVQL